MFTNKGKTPDLPAIPEPGPKRTQPSRMMTSIIANGVRIEGAIIAEGAELQVDGEIDGNVRGGALTVGDTGFVKGDVMSESVIVNGRVEGSIRARKVTLSRTAHVQGDITHQQLSVEMGAVFEGQCRYVQDPLKAVEQAPSYVGPGGQIAGPMGAQMDPHHPQQQQHPQHGGFGQPISGVVVTGAQ
jgi:cytoskeletal protein CcmA (bactofilin family)